MTHGNKNKFTKQDFTFTKPIKQEISIVYNAFLGFTGFINTVTVCLC